LDPARVSQYARPILSGIAIALMFAAIAASRAAGVGATTQGIVAGSTTIISQDARGNPYAESFLAVDPKRPAALIATALTVDNGELDSALYESQDAGAHWRRVSTGPHFDTADPIVYFGPTGRAFFESEGHGGLDFMSSDDGGITWRPFRFVRVGDEFDRPYIGFDSQGPFAGRMYAAAYVAIHDPKGGMRGTVAVTISRDDGETFSIPQLIDVAGFGHGFSVPIPGDVLVGPDGTVVLPFQLFNYKGSPHGSYPGTYEVLISKDGGISFSGASAAHVTTLCCNSYRATSVIGGVRGSVDLSESRYRGRFYLVWPNYNGHGTDIDVVHSSDDGRTWSKPVRVNDNFQPSDDANPTIAVNDRGIVGVVWNDRRNDHGTSCYRLFGSASLDGGATFLPNVPLSKSPTCPNDAKNWAPVFLMEQHQPGKPDEKWLNVLTVATRWPNGGDTQGLQGLADGSFGAAWIDGASGVMQLAYTRFTVEGDVASAVAMQHATAGTATTAADVGSQLDLDVANGTFDPARGVFSVRLQLKNVSSSPVRGPFAVILKRVMSNLPGLRATNADNHLTGKSSEWTLGDSAWLAPGQRTAAREAIWRFAGYPKEPQYPVFIFEVKRAK
jgi:hypothetical protein